MTPLTISLARRELRGGLRRFGVFLACLALGVGVIAGVGTLSEAIERALAQDARALLGGDAQLRTTFAEIPPDVLAYVQERGQVSRSARMRAMAGSPGGSRTLVELKAVDETYPFYGDMVLTPDIDLEQALAVRDGLPGAVADQELLTQLGLSVGQRIVVGDMELELRAAIDKEPDRVVSAFALGPRLMISMQALEQSGLVLPGSMVRSDYNIRLPSKANAQRFVKDLSAAFPDAPWSVSDYTRAAPGVRRVVERMGLFLTLVGLTALLVGGLGVAGAVDGYLSGKLRSIAILKCLGAHGALVTRVYLAQILAIALVGTLLGLALGLTLSWVAAGTLAGWLPVEVRVGFFMRPLATAAGFGMLTALVFSLPPLLRARAVRPAGLFRSYRGPGRQPLTGRARLYVVLAGLALAGFAIAVTPQRSTAAWFALAAALAFGLQLLLGRGLARLAGALKPRDPLLAMALRSLRRSGNAPTAMASLGLGLTVLVAIMLVQGNLRRQVDMEMPASAPSFFFVDIQPHQVEQFESAVGQVAGVERVERMPMLRARITAIDGVPVSKAKVDPSVAWAARGDRGVTYAAELPEHNRLVAGEWWPEDYAGEPLVSLAADIAEGFGVGVGGTLTLNVQGRGFEVRIANLREVEWTSLAMNFSLVMSPGFLESAPQTHLATVYAAPGSEDEVFKAVTSILPNVTAVRVKDALATVSRMLSTMGRAVLAVASVTLAAGLLVLAEALRAGLRRRYYEAVVLKTLGATRRDVLVLMLWEHLALGLGASLSAALLGSLAAWLSVTRLMEAVRWTFLPGMVAGTAAAGTLAVVLFGLAGMRRMLGQRPWQVLRNE
ncbi:ABC transporter permease [Desulfocurvibacter africanus]|uniref:ABC transporter permease n=1 Tax=Desulfocurvibacter africanus TaxID=873 RepID=UPI0003F5C06E|nr:FtsX-like permease family protein [Desulfocurvibacter africanus]